MFVRVKKVGPYQYLQIAQNRREGKRVKQSIIATLGRLDKLTTSGAVDQLLRSAARFAERLMVLAEHSSDAHDAPDTKVVSIGPALLFERLWRETGCQAVVRKLLTTRHHHFDVERAVFMTVLHRLFDATICGHVFCSFLALVLRDELFRRMDNVGVSAEWDDVLRDLNALTETTITYSGKSFAVRSNAVGVAGKIAQCVGVRLPNTVRQVDVEAEGAEPSH